MGFTYTAQNAIDLVRKYIKDIPLSGASVDITISDYVSSVMYTAYPWRWTLGALTSIALTNGNQDYTVANSDFYRLVRARLSVTSDTPDTFKELDIAEALPPLAEVSGTDKEDFSKIAYDQITNKVRLDKAFSSAGGNTINIDGEYQKNPTKITALTATFWFPDQYFPVYAEGIQWKAYQFADDDRAGTITYDDSGRRQFTGQMGIFFASLQSMVQAEDWGNAQPYSFPINALGITKAGWLGTANKQ